MTFLLWLMCLAVCAAQAAEEEKEGEKMETDGAEEAPAATQEEVNEEAASVSVAGCGRRLTDEELSGLSITMDDFTQVSTA